MQYSRFRQLALVGAVVAPIAACGGKSGSSDTITGSPTLTASASAGDAQTAIVAHTVATAPSVKVTNSAGAPQSGVNVNFAIASGGGTVGGAAQTTGADGIATVGSWKLGNIAGANSLSATVASATGSPVTFSATGVADAAASLTKTDGDAITSAAGVNVSAKPSVKVSDAFGNAVSGSVVTFAVASGGGTVSGATQTTGANGIATVGGWILGNLVGVNTLTATASNGGVGGSPATFTATGVAGPVAALAKVAGDAQSIAVGSLVPVAPSVRVSDQFGNLIANQVVNFSAATGGGSVTGAAPVSSSLGIATVGGWTLGAVPGANTLTATAASASVTFTAQALAVFNAVQYAGTYSGTWTNTTFGSTGTGTALVTVNSAASTATVTVNVTGQVLGTGGVSNAVNSGAYTSNGTTFTGNVSPMGNITAVMSASGAITASGVNPPNTAISRWDATGSITSTTLQMSYTVTFVSGPPATGTITLTKP